MELACRNCHGGALCKANLVKLLDLWSAGWNVTEERTLKPGLREVCWTLWAVRARRGGRGFQCHGPARGLQRGEPLSQEPLWAGTGHSEYAWALESCTGPRGLHRRAGVDRRRRGGLHGLAGRQEGGPRELRGRWLDMHDKPVSFDARRYHMVEPHEGSMWALAAYVPQAYARATEQHRQALREASFPLPA